VGNQKLRFASTCFKAFLHIDTYGNGAEGCFSGDLEIPMKQHNWFIVLIVVLVLLLTSCGKAQPPTTAVGKTLWSFSQSIVWAVDWSPDGKKIATGEDNGKIQVLEKEQGNVLLTMKGNATIDA
jgi:WD40 repeat protein